MSPNAWKSVSVILLTAVAIWYANEYEPWGVLLGLAVCWRYLIGDKTQEAPQSAMSDAQFDESYPCQGHDAFSQASYVRGRILAVEQTLLGMSVAEMTSSMIDPSGGVIQWAGRGRDALIVGDQLVVLNEVLATIEQVILEETALTRAIQA